MVRSAIISLYWYMFACIHSALRIIRGIEAKSLLDVSCGKSRPLKSVEHLYKVGLDIDLNSLKLAKCERTHSDFVLGDASRLPFRDKSFDVVICMQVLHLIPELASKQALLEIERVARKRIVITVPHGLTKEKYQKSVWDKAEFIRRGYKVMTWGFRQFYSLVSKKSINRVSRVVHALDPLAGIIGMLVKSLSHYPVCWKELRINSKN